MTDDQTIAKVNGWLQPDRQTVVAEFTHGACDAAAEATGTVQGDVATLRVVIGTDPEADDDDICDLVGVTETVLIRLPQTVPPNARLVSAPCGKPELPCYDG